MFCLFAIFWRKIKGPPLDLFMPDDKAGLAVRVTGEGQYEFELTVTDPYKLSGLDTVVLTVVDDFAPGIVPVITLNCTSYLIPSISQYVELTANAYVDSYQGLRT